MPHTCSCMRVCFLRAVVSEWHPPTLPWRHLFSVYTTHSSATHNPVYAPTSQLPTTHYYPLHQQQHFDQTSNLQEPKVNTQHTSACHWPAALICSKFNTQRQRPSAWQLASGIGICCGSLPRGLETCCLTVSGTMTLLLQLQLMRRSTSPQQHTHRPYLQEPKVYSHYSAHQCHAAPVPQSTSATEWPAALTHLSVPSLAPSVGPSL